MVESAGKQIKVKRNYCRYCRGVETRAREAIIGNGPPSRSSSEAFTINGNEGAPSAFPPGRFGIPETRQKLAKTSESGDNGERRSSERARSEPGASQERDGENAREACPSAGNSR